LVLGNYIVIISHEATVLVGEDRLCVLTVGILEHAGNPAALPTISPFSFGRFGEL
jgi:hypothetical protein